MYRKYGKGSLWVRSHIDARIPDVAAQQLINPNYYVRLVEELRPLTYSLVGRKSKLMPKDEWATILGHSPDVADALIQSMILTS